jgi:S-(hydroxymethyl)glutathione dehydrogenase/alcohol dehydrogenase
LANGWQQRSLTLSGYLYSVTILKKAYDEAAVLHEVDKPPAIEDVSLQKPGPGEVLIRTAVAGLCHSDLHFMEGLYPHPLPTVLSHESAGVVEQVQ